MSESASQPGTLLRVRDLRTHFFTADGVVRAVDGISFDLAAGETLGIVGESGCGKSVTALSILRLIAPETGRIVGGSIAFDGQELTTLSLEAMRELRGHKIAMIFQEPMTSLNPVLTVGTQIAESVVRHLGLSWREANDRAHEMLELVRIGDARRRLDEYPHQLSGGMRQRVMIAIALSCNPRVLIADEPTTALDVTIQAQILDLMLELKEKLGTAIILITHDLGVVAETCERVIVMYAGRMVEQATAADLFARPLHPYTRGLLRALPRADDDVAAGGARPKLAEIPGIVPALTRPIPGCAFAPRCDFVVERCRADGPRADGGRRLAPGRLLGSGPRGGGGGMSAPARQSARQPGGAGPRQAFPGRRRLAAAAPRGGEGGRRRQLRHPARGDAGAGRRIRVRQDDCQPHGAEAAGADRRPGAARRRRRHRPEAGADVGAPPPRADRVPGPLFLAQPAPDRRRHRRRAHGEFRASPPARSGSAGWPSCSPASACAPRAWASIRTSSPAASASGSASPRRCR